MASALNRLDRSTNFFYLLNTLNPLPHSLFIFPAQPILVVFAHVHGTLELGRPVEVRGVVVRMADDDGFETTFGMNKVNRIIVEERNEIPKYIAITCLKQDGALSYT
jgi:hypothetical protein